MMKIKLPPKKDSEEIELEFDNLVIVGANGSGKTRFGSKIEQTYPKYVHRISAQKSLEMPTITKPSTKERAELNFFYGTYAESWSEQTYIAEKYANRWGRNVNTHLLNDFNKLMTLLQTEEYEAALDYKEGRIEKPTTKLDVVQNIWETILPHRKLLKQAGKIQTYPTGRTQDNYDASEMSDGERVIFYLIGEVICAPESCIIIIDEPEMHIHKTILKRMFDLIESHKDTCSFIYLTHDIDFAFSRTNAKKIWTKGYLGSEVWDYEILENRSNIPEQLYLELIGSRNPVLFIEGDNSSIDYTLFSKIYPEKTIKPIGSCDKVIQCVKSFNEEVGFHRISSNGIIDRDRRNDDQVRYLNSKNVWVLDVAEIENIFLLEPIVNEVSKLLGKEPVETFLAVKTEVIQFFTELEESQILLHSKDILRKTLIEISNFDNKELEKANDEIKENLTAIDLKEIHNEIKEKFDQIISEQNYNEVLKVFNLKNAIIPRSKICSLLGLKDKSSYINIIYSIIDKGGESSEIIVDTIKQTIIKNAT